jgi:uracil DNA glycosylase
MWAGNAPANGHLGGWAARGVLLLNTSLTVEEGIPGSHARLGWQALTDIVVLPLRTMPSSEGVHAVGRPCSAQVGADP